MVCGLGGLGLNIPANHDSCDFSKAATSRLELGDRWGCSSSMRPACESLNHRMRFSLSVCTVEEEAIDS